MRQTSQGLWVFDLLTDQYDHTKVAANWDLVDSLIGAPAKSVQVTASLPNTGLFAGELVMLSAANGGFPAWTLLRYDGSAWHPVGYEIQPAVPTSGNFAGRLVLLSSASAPFNAWDLIRYDGVAWSIVGGFQSINNGAGATNIKGLTTTGDIYISDGTRGFVLKDRVTGTTYRLYITKGGLAMEVVT